MFKAFARSAAVAATLLLSTGASAQDRTPSWSGFYVGGHFGYGSADIARHLTKQDGILIAPSPQSYSIGADGWLGGAQIGAQTQIGQWVLGAEASFSLADLDGKSGADFLSPLYADCTLAGFSCESKGHVKSLATFTGRLGYATANWMLYAKAGLALAEVEVNWDARLNGADRTKWRGDARLPGWTAGLGFEYRVARNTTLGIEYAYTDLHSRDISNNYTTFGVPFNVLTDRMSVDDMHTVTLRLNYYLTGN